MNYYLICFSLSLIISVIFLFRNSGKHNADLSIFYVLVTMASLACWQRSVSTVLEEAILAHKFSYIAGSYITITLLFNILTLTKIEISTPIRIFLMVSASLISAICLSIGHGTLFYKSVEFVMIGKQHVLVRQPGILHTIYYAFLLINYSFCIFALLHGIRNNKKTSMKTVIQLLILMGVGLFAYFGTKLFTYELIPAWYVLASVVFLIIDDNLKLYQVDQTVITSLIRQNTMGVVSFDKNFNFLGCNDAAKKFYPPISKLIIDRKPNPNIYDINEICSWIDFFKRGVKNEFHYKDNDRHFKVVFQDLYFSNKKKGYQVIFTDCTEEKNRESKLIKISITDELTKLFNRRAFEEEIEKIQSDGIPEDFTIISFDLNGLKAANDTKGHAAGDELIIASAKTLNAVLEPYGYVYRTGGDEYIAIAICSKEDLEEIFSLIDNYSRLWKGEYNQGLSISKGAASITEFPESTIDQLEKEAEKRMYADKTRYYLESGIERRKR